MKKRKSNGIRGNGFIIFGHLRFYTPKLLRCIILTKLGFYGIIVLKDENNLARVYLIRSIPRTFFERYGRMTHISVPKSEKYSSLQLILLDFWSP